MKGASNNPGMVKLEFHDHNWPNDGAAYTYLTDIGSSQWKQWLVPVDASQLIVTTASFDPANITEVIVTIENTSATSNVGSVYIDDLTFVDATDVLTPYPGLVVPESTPVDLSTLGYPHTLKDYADGLEGNDYHGINDLGYSEDPAASISNTISTAEYYTSPALEFNYDVSTSGSFAYYFNTLEVNSDKLCLALYMKAGANNPGVVKLEFHDINWPADGAAYTYLSGISSSQWQQWIVPVDASQLIKTTPTFDQTQIKEVVVTFENTTIKEGAGTLYIDDLTFVDATDELTPFPGRVVPEYSPVDLSTLGYPHVLKDFSDGLEGNDYHGVNSEGASDLASISQTLSSVEYYTSPALELDYDVTGAESYAFYFNTMEVNSDKEYLSVFMKAGANNPVKVKMEFHDVNWPNDGSAYIYLTGIKSSEWQQWLVPIDASKFTIVTPNFDETQIKEVVITLENEKASDDAGTLYIDDLTFVDATDLLTPFPGRIVPEYSPVDLSTLGYPHTLKDFFDGLEGNDYHGVNSEGASDLASISQTLSSVEYYTSPALELDYDVTGAESYAFYFNTMEVNSDKEYLSVFMKAGANNPVKVKMEFHDVNWPNDGSAYIYLTGIKSSEWQQWLVPIDASKFTIVTPNFDETQIKEVVITLENEKASDDAGTLYIDDLTFVDATDLLTPFPGRIVPEYSPVDLSTLGYPHTLKDFFDGLEGNDYHGVNSEGASDLASISQTLSSVEYYTSPALELDYDVTGAESYAFYFNTMEVNSDKEYLSVFMKAGANNPVKVKMEFHDVNWPNDGSAYIYLTGIKSSEWQQWLVPIDASKFTIVTPNFDETQIKEVVITLENEKASDDAGTLYIDDLTFVDATDLLTPFPGRIVPEYSPVDLSTLGYPHTLKDFFDGLEGNDYHGVNSEGASDLASISQTLSSVEYYTSPALELDYDVTGAESYAFYFNTMEVNSDKEYLSVFMKAGANNPVKVKMEFHDVNWPNDGSAYIYLTGIKSSEWQQWLVPIDASKFTIVTPNFDETQIKEVVITLENEKASDDAGTLYIDDLTFVDATDVLTPYPGLVVPESTPVDLSTLGYPHTLKDYADGLEGNDYHGINDLGYSEDPAASISNTISTAEYYTSPALEFNYDVSTSGSFAYYFNTLEVNSDKLCLALYMKAGANNPGVVKLEFHDINWPADGAAYTYLSGISSSQWQQWIVPVDASQLIKTTPTFDQTQIKEVVVTFENTTIKEGAGTLYIDDLTFVDATDLLTPFPGVVIPESVPVNLSTLGYPHAVKDYNGGLYGNEFFGDNGVGHSSDPLKASQTLSTTEYHSAPSSLEFNYDVPGVNSFAFYFNTLRLNSDKLFLSLMAKGGTNYPGRIKIELHDINNGNAITNLLGINNTEWQQWLVPIDISKLEILTAHFDPANIKEIIITVMHNPSDPGIGKVFIDDITFVDATDDLTPLSGLAGPEISAVNYKDVGVPYQIDDFDTRVISPSGQNERNFNDFMSYNGYFISDGTGDQAEFIISSTETGGPAHSIPYAGKLDFDFANHSGSEIPIVYYSDLRLPSLDEPNTNYVDISEFDEIALWLRSASGTNPGNVRISLKDLDGKSANCILTGISDTQWKQYRIPVNTTGMNIQTGFDFTSVKEFSLDIIPYYSDVAEGEVYFDDIAFIETDMAFTSSADFDLSNKNNAFLNLLEKNTFNYFMKSFDQESGLVRDRITFNDLASVAATGWGLTALPIGVERGWITREEAKSLVLKSLNTLWNTPQGTAISGQSGFKGFYYHYLDIKTGLRSGTSELSNVDTQKLLQGIFTAKQYFNDAGDPDEIQIGALADSIYHRIEWPWFLNTEGTPETNENYNLFYLGWTPEYEFEDKDGNTYYWNVFTDETTLVNLAAIASPTHPVSTDVFYAWLREQGRYNGRGLTMSYFGSLFQYMFAHCWYDLKDKKDGMYLNHYDNAIQAGLANRDFCIAGVDGTGRTGVPTYHANSWGLTACDAIPAGKQDYLGENGTLPNVQYKNSLVMSNAIDGTVPPYGGISMIGFCDSDGLMPVEHISGLTENFYRNTQLWTGYYGFRDCYTDTAVIKQEATSKFPAYRNDHVAIDQGPMLVMIENYRSGLIRSLFMQNLWVQNAVNAIFTDVATPAEPSAEDLSIVVNKTGSEFIENFDGDGMVQTWEGSAPGIYNLSVDNTITNDGTNCLKIDFDKQTGEEWSSVLGNFPQIEDLSGYEFIRFRVYGNIPLMVKIENSSFVGPELAVTGVEGEWKEFDFNIHKDDFDISAITRFVIIPLNGELGSGTMYIDQIQLIQNRVEDAIYEYIPEEGDVLTADYTFSDPNGDPEMNSTFRWLTSTEYNGTYTAIPGATASSYTMMADDVGNYIKFEVTPRSIATPYLGSPVTSLPIRTADYYDLYLDVPFTAKENEDYSGAACIDMILDYEDDNSITQSSIQQYGINQNHSVNQGSNFIDPYGMFRSLNHFELDPNFNYAQMMRNTKEEAYKDICYWISYNLPNVNRIHMPSVVPTGSNFNNWMVINGFQASGNPHVELNYTLFGFYVKDPNIENGIGQDIYVQASSFGNNYYKPIVSSDIWNGKYVSVNEPPMSNNVLYIQSAKSSSQNPSTNELRFVAAEEGLLNYHLYNNSSISNSLIDATRGRIYFVDKTGTNDDYYIVTFEKNNGCVAAVIIDANNGALKEVSYVGEPDYDYYNHIEGVRLKSFTSEKIINSFYPLNIANITDEEENVETNELKESETKIKFTPNPASDFTRLNYSIPTEGVVSINIYNLSGKIVKKVFNNYQPIGNYTLELDLKDFKTGVYLCRFICGEELSVKKLVISK
jgi:hypothetical protein